MSHAVAGRLLLEDSDEVLDVFQDVFRWKRAGGRKVQRSARVGS